MRCDGARSRLFPGSRECRLGWRVACVASACVEICVASGTEARAQAVAPPGIDVDPAGRSGGDGQEPLAEVTVEAEESAEEAAPRDPLPVTVIDAKKYAGRATDLNELLDRTSGVKVRQAGGAGSSSTISVRGLEGRRVAVFLDGHPLNTPDGSFGINDLPLQLVDHVEVYKGVVPARLGGDGLGSAVNVVLRDRQTSYADFGYSYASYAVQRAFAFGKYVDESAGFKAAAGAIVNTADNDYLMPRSNGAAVRRNHDGFWSVLAGGNFELARTWFSKAKLELGYVQNAKELQGVPPVGDSGVSQYDIHHARTQSQLGVVALELEKRDAAPGLDLSYDVALPYFRSRLRDTSDVVYDFDGNARPNPNGRGEVGRGPNDSDNRRWDLLHTFNASYAFSPQYSLNANHNLGVTWDRPRDELANTAAGVNVTPREGSLQRSVSALAFEGRWLDDRWVTVGAVKHFYFQSEGALTSAYDIVTAEPERVSQSQHTFGGSIASRFQLLGPLLFKASYEHAARLPSAEELFGDGLIVQGSTALRPEVSDNWNAGFYLDLKGEGRRLQLEVTGFASQIRDLITLGGALTRNYANTGAAELRGVELDVKADATRFLSLYANGTYQDLRDAAEFIAGTTQPNYLRGLPIPNVPRFYSNWGAELHGHWLAGASVRTRVFYDASYVGEYFYEYEVSRNQSRRIPGYVVHSLGLQQTFDYDRYSTNVELHDVGDVARLDEFNQPLPGRSVRLLFRMTLL
jgi:vitamin B12 transporter